MPINYSLYPPNWIAIRNEVLIRAGGSKDNPTNGSCCEWCGVRNYSVGYANANGKFMSDGKSYDLAADARKEARLLKEKTGDKYIAVCLAIAHVNDPNTMNCSMDNLAALCQRCHHNLDLKLKQKHEAMRKRKSLMAAGQLDIWNSAPGEK